MKLTEKDKMFLEKLHDLLESKQLWIEKKSAVPSYFVLRGNYGEKISEAFGMTRQGVRWRFHHIFTDIYVEAFEVIWMVERNFGASLRQAAMEISKERFLLRERAKRANFTAGDHLAGKGKD